MAKALKFSVENYEDRDTIISSVDSLGLGLSYTCVINDEGHNLYIHRGTELTTEQEDSIKSAVGGNASFVGNGFPENLINVI